MCVKVNVWSNLRIWWNVWMSNEKTRKRFVIRYCSMNVESRYMGNPALTSLCE